MVEINNFFDSGLLKHKHVSHDVRIFDILSFSRRIN